MNEFVKVLVPATTANCGPGFDVLGMALEFYNEIELKLLKDNELIIENYGAGVENLPTDNRNLVWKSIKKVLDEAKSNYKGAHIKFYNKVPLSRGLGSSASAIVAGLYASNVYLGEIFSKEQLLLWASEIEGHPDNVAPALFGGMVVSNFYNKEVKYVRFIPAIPLKLIVAIPDFTLETSKAREVLPQKVLLEDAIFNIGNTSLIVASLMQGKIDVLKGIFEDKIHQPYRMGLIYGIEDVFEAAIKNGALGVCISGAGPALIAYGIDKEFEIGKSMVKAFEKNNIKSECKILNIDNKGAHVVN